MCVLREPPVKKILYWCTTCNVPLIAKSCACGRDGKRIELLQPYDVRPALAADTQLIRTLVHERFGPVPLPKIILLNKTGGCLLYTSPSPRDRQKSRMPSSA